MNSEELKNLIESARVAKGISQRELAKLTGISRSTLNDLINGKIKKVDIDDLRKIAETLDMSLQKLLKAAGYDEMSLYFHAHKSKDKYIDKSSKDLKELIEKYKKSELELLDFDTQKRNKVSDVRQKLFYTMEHLQIMKDNKDLVVDYLKVGHHGSKSSSIQQFLEMVKPEIALIGVGEKNTFGHPNGEVLERLNELRL